MSSYYTNYTYYSKPSVNDCLAVYNKYAVIINNLIKKVYRKIGHNSKYNFKVITRLVNALATVRGTIHENLPLLSISLLIK